MNNAEAPVTQTENKTEVPVTQTEEKTEVDNTSNNAKEKTFTQEQVNAILTKERNKMPSKEELQEFNNWKESQKTAEQKQAEATAQALKIEEENNAKSQLLDVLKRGVEYEQAEFIQFKLSKMEGDFSTNLDEYMKAHPVKQEENKRTTGYSQQGNATNNSNKDYLDAKYGKNPYYKK